MSQVTRTVALISIRSVTEAIRKAPASFVFEQPIAVGFSSSVHAYDVFWKKLTIPMSRFLHDMTPCHGCSHAVIPNSNSRGDPPKMSTHTRITKIGSPNGGHFLLSTSLRMTIGAFNSAPGKMRHNPDVGLRPHFKEIGSLLDPRRVLKPRWYEAFPSPKCHRGHGIRPSWSV